MSKTESKSSYRHRALIASESGLYSAPPLTNKPPVIQVNVRSFLDTGGTQAGYRGRASKQPSSPNKHGTIIVQQAMQPVATGTKKNKRYKVKKSHPSPVLGKSTIAEEQNVPLEFGARSSFDKEKYLPRENKLEKRSTNTHLVSKSTSIQFASDSQVIAFIKAYFKNERLKTYRMSTFGRRVLTINSEILDEAENLEIPFSRLS